MHPSTLTLIYRCTIAQWVEPGKLSSFTLAASSCDIRCLFQAEQHGTQNNRRANHRLGSDRRLHVAGSGSTFGLGRSVYRRAGNARRRLLYAVVRKLPWHEPGGSRHVSSTDRRCIPVKLERLNSRRPFRTHSHFDARRSPRNSGSTGDCRHRGFHPDFEPISCRKNRTAARSSTPERDPLRNAQTTRKLIAARQEFLNAVSRGTPKAVSREPPVKFRVVVLYGHLYAFIAHLQSADHRDSSSGIPGCLERANTIGGSRCDEPPGCCRRDPLVGSAVFRSLGHRPKI